MCRARSGESSCAEVLDQTLLEFRARKAVVLGAARLDLDRPHERGDATAGLPVQATHQAVQKSGAVSVTAAGRIDDHPRPGAADLDRPLMGVDERSGRTARDDQRL